MDRVDPVYRVGVREVDHVDLVDRVGVRQADRVNPVDRVGVRQVDRVDPVDRVGVRQVDRVDPMDQVDYRIGYMVALAWIQSDAHRWKQFVANRVTKIQELTGREHWTHCPGKENPADLVAQ